MSGPEDYRLHRAALEWDLTDPIVIESRRDLKSEPRWTERLEPYHHQVRNLVTFCRRLPVTLIADEVGLGKTISAGLIASELISRSRVSKILIVCPKLLIPQWQEELETKFEIRSRMAIGRELIDAEPQDDSGAVVTTYHSARLYLDKLPHDRFQMLVLDEAHKLRNLYGVTPPPQVAQRFRQVLADRQFRYVLMLTATPIHNRLWDLYSLVELLTVARGHDNPFGTEGLFARRFIADDRTKARYLNPRMRDEFRAIVYGYMSRVRRADAKLHFPERVVQLHRVQPTAEENELIQLLAEPVRQVKDRRAQISILQALTSSPHALSTQLKNMARNRTFPADVAAAVETLVARMSASAKLRGLAALVERLRSEEPDDWRMVIFTGRLETQTTIQSFLQEQGIPVGVINGASSGQRDQETIKRFWKRPRECRVIVSTERGSEGVNLQVANVLVNYDLPWNPMIVEQRIGRIQRLASSHASVCIVNLILDKTFEEYIVGRLMEKLQMAAHAIGDMEALLQAAGMDEEEENGTKGFEEKIRELVLASLAGRDIEAATRKAEQSIDEAKLELEREEKTINDMLGTMEGAEYAGPRAPKLPPTDRSMDASAFVLAALASTGARLTQTAPDCYVCEHERGSEEIRIAPEASGHFPGDGVLYAPGTPAFERLVGRLLATGVHSVEDVDKEPLKHAEELSRQWVAQFGAVFSGAKLSDVCRGFEGTALIRVRATVAHDSYERLVEVACPVHEHLVSSGKGGLDRVRGVIRIPAGIGLNATKVIEVASADAAIAEFCRFYSQRKEEEIRAAAGDVRKAKKLEDDFTPRLEFELAALDGKVHRRCTMQVSYKFDDGPEYTSSVTVVPITGETLEAPPIDWCGATGRMAPRECFARCEVTGKDVLRHLLIRSELSGRQALIEHGGVCTHSGKRVLCDELESSAVTNQLVARVLLNTSALSGKRAEPQFFGSCEFTGAEVLTSELAVSQASEMRYRVDQEQRSTVSGKSGHRQEFVTCYETRQAMLAVEAERCESTGRIVRPGILQECSVTHKRVVPSEMERSAVSGKCALKRLFVTSSCSGARMLEEEAIRSTAGNCCMPSEAKTCKWGGRRSHPDDVRTCELTGLTIHAEFATAGAHPRLQVLADLLDGIEHRMERGELASVVAEEVAVALRAKRCRIEAARLSPNGQRLAVSVEVPTLLGWSLHQAGAIYAIDENALVGRIAYGKRKAQGWESQG
jgi:superfamily II DNA or RNA helicase